MASYIDWYLIELEGRLTGRMPAERVFMVTSETHDHLRQKTDDLVAAGMPAASAERTATNSFGSPSRIAFEVIEGAGSSQTARLGRWLVGAGAVIAFGMILASAATSARGTSGEAPLDMALGFGIPLTIIGSLMARRSNAKSILLAAVPVSLLAGLMMPIGHVAVNGLLPQTRGSAKQDRSYRQSDIDSMNEAKNALTTGLAAYAKLDGDPHKALSAIQSAPHTTANSYIVLPPVSQWSMEPSQLGVKPHEDPYPTYPYRYEMDPVYGYRPIFSAETTKSLSTAEASWKANGPHLVEAADRRIAANNQMITALDAQLQNSPRFSWVLLGCGMMITFLCAISLTLVNVICIGLARAWRWGRVRKSVRA